MWPLGGRGKGRKTDTRARQVSSVLPPIEQSRRGKISGDSLSQDTHGETPHLTNEESELRRFGPVGVGSRFEEEPRELVEEHDAGSNDVLLG